MNTNVINKGTGTAGLPGPGSRRTLNGDTDRSETSLTKAKAHGDVLGLMLAALSEGRITEFVERFGDDFKFTDHALNLQFREHQQLSEFLKKSRERFPDTVMEAVSVFQSGDAAIVEWKLTATETISAGSMKLRTPILLSGV